MKYARLALFGSVGIVIGGLLLSRDGWETFTAAYWYAVGVGACWWQWGRQSMKEAKP